ncbi:hypothetical protein Pint_28117 [Pistacia integerrima]|uniref:Uncharacterized protein n=1 Tax=Pistacia integerrima TaxID=434235 RepID=A0ACC0YNS2_9ROSI|nr:hypothetical protein Pint_28117 [Pistacia integerrima]
MIRQVMAAAFFGGAFLGAVFAELLRAISEKHSHMVYLNRKIQGQHFLCYCFFNTHCEGALDNELKESYTDLGSCPDNQRIPVAALIDMWIELYKRIEDDLYDLNLVVTR